MDSGRRSVASLAQERMWFLQQWETGSAAHNVLLARRLRGPLDPDALRAAVAALARRHEALRTRFELAGDVLQQVVLPDADLPLAVRDVPEPELRAAVREEHGRGFDPTRAPLARASLLRLAERDHVLLLNVHHLVFDEWSAGVLGRDLGALYAAAAAGEQRTLPELPRRYADFATWEREWIAGPEARSQLEHWRRALAGAPPVLDLPLDRPRPPARTDRGSSSPVSLPPELVAGLDRLGGRAECTPFATLLATFALLLHRWSGCADLVIAVPVANRPDARYRDVVGLFTNTLPLRVRVDGERDGLALLRHVREVVLEGLANQQVPFDHVVRAAGRRPRAGVPPLAQVMFSLTGSPGESMDAELARAGLAVRPVPLEGLTAKFDLSLCLDAGAAGTRGSLEYSGDVLDEATARELTRAWRTLAVELAAGPERPLAALPAGTGRGPARAAPRLSGRVDEVAWRVARRDPGRIAVSGGGRAATFGQVTGGAAGLAARLRALRLPAHAPVLVALEPGPGALVAWLGVLRAGAVVLPVAPGRLPDLPLHALPDVAAAVADGPAAAALAAAGLPVLAPALGAGDDVPDPGPEAAGPAGPAGAGVPACLLPAGDGDASRLLAFDHASLLAVAAWERTALVGGNAFRVLARSAIDAPWSIAELVAPLCLGGTAVVDSGGGGADLAFVTELDLLRGEAPSAATLVVAGDGVVVPPAARSGRVLSARYVPGCLLPCRAEWAPGRVETPAAAFVVDRLGRPALAGARGELCLAGPGVAAGVAGRPDLTAAMLRPDDGGGRRLHTGELVRAPAAGGLELLGPLGRPLLLDGHPVRPAQVEAALRRHPGVAAAAVVTVPGPGGGPRLVAVVCGRPGGRPAPAEAAALEHLRPLLPAAALPARVLTVDALPGDRFGRLDRGALVTVALAAAAGDTGDLLEAALARRRAGRGARATTAR